jgi:plastocyanin
MSRALRSALLGAAVLSTVALTSCGDDSDAESDAVTTVESASGSTTVEPPDDDGGPSSVAPNGEEVEVLALDNNFRPEELEVEAGTTVIWENGGRNDHNIVPADDSDSWGVGIEQFRPGDVYSYAFTTPGEYPYYCTLHGTADFGMIGTVVVTG